MGETNLLSGIIKNRNDEMLVVDTPFGRHGLPASALRGGEAVPGTAVDLCFRPEHLNPEKTQDDALDLGIGTIRDMSFFGSHHRCHVTIPTMPDRTLVMHLPQSSQLREGDTVSLHLNTNTIMLFLTD